MPPTLTPAGTLTYTPAPDAFGTNLITVTLEDNGGVDNGGANASTAQTFTIAIVSVNDRPTLNPLANVTIDEDAGNQTVPLAGIGAGAANETQTLTVTAKSDKLI